MRGLLVAILAIVATASIAHAGGEDYGNGTVVFARGNSLYRTSPTGKGETEIAVFVTKAPVRALRTDALGKVLLVDIGGTWGWLPLDGSTKTIVSLPCAEGPAQLADDGSCVVCRSPKTASGASALGSAATSTLIVNLANAKTLTIDVPVVGARVIGTGKAHRFVWADKTGVWSAPPGDLKQRVQLAAESPLRGFLPSTDGLRAVGVYADTVYESAHKTKPADVLMGFQLDGVAARRKAIKNAVPVEWSHDGKWILVQDTASACVMSAQGGEYKCWKGFTAGSTSPDGRWTLVLGNRDGGKPPAKPARSAKPPKVDKPDKPSDVPSGEPETEGVDLEVIPDVAITLPTGPLALYRARLEGAFTERPTQIVKVVDGAAVWVPAATP